MEKKAPDQRQQETVHYEAPPPYEPLVGVVATAPMVAPPAPPTLFGVGERNYCTWFWYFVCCPGCAMFSLGRRLKESWAVLYIVLGALVFMAVGAFNYFNNMYMMAQQGAAYDYMDIDWTEHYASLACNMGIAALIVSVLSLITTIVSCLQRRRYIRQTKQEEEACVSLFAIFCCAPCAYGQMGATEIV